MKKSIMKYIFFAVIAFGGCVSFCAPMDGCMPVHLERSAFKSNKDYDEYNRVYQEFFRCYRDVINYINNRGDNPEIDALINECREIARSDRWGESRLIVGYSGNVSVACLSNLRTSVSRLSRKINDYFYKEGSKVPKAQKSGRDIQNNRSSQKGNVKDGRELLDPDFLPYCIVSGTAKEWKNAKGKTMRGEWHYISQKGDVIWLYDVEKKKYIKMPVANLSQEDKDYIRGWVSDFLTQGMKWKYGNYLTADQIREVEYILEARTKIFDRSISGRKDIKVVQAWEFGGLCDYGMGNSSSFRAENQNLIYWQTGEKGVLANGDILSNQIMYWAGTTKYETVNHNVNTVACYCNDFDFAIRLVRCRLHLYDDGDKRFDDTTPAPKQNDSPSKNWNKPTGYGSGFFVTENGYLISNYHVVKGAESCFAVTENGRFKLSLIGIDERTDLALLKANGAFVPVSFSRKRIEKLGATVFTAGFPMPDSQGFSPKVTKGIVSGDKGMNDNPMHYQIDASIQPGNSGGPVCDESGNVIAVVVSMLSSKYYFENQGLVPQNVNYAIKKSYLEAFLGNYSSCAENVKDGDTSSIDFSSAVEKVKHSIALIEVY